MVENKTKAQHVLNLLHSSVPDEVVIEAAKDAVSEIEGLQAEVSRLKRANRTMNVALQRIASWREASHEYDADCGYEPREFGNKDWDHIEACANYALDTATHNPRRPNR